MVDLMQKYVVKKYLALRFKRLKFPISPFVILDDLLESQYWSRERIRNYQLNKINRLVDAAARDTSYYKKKINGNFRYFANLENFSQDFPRLCKSDFFENQESLKNKNIANRFKHSTSGSTGEPMTIEISGRAEAYRLAGKMRFYSWWGVDFHDKSVLIWKLNEVEREGFNYTRKIKTKLKNRLDLNIFELNDESVFNYVTQIDEFAPKYIRSYKSGLYELARLMEKHGLRFKTSNLKVAIVTSEVLLEEERAFIGRIFDCAVANEYGSAEGGFYAGECQHGSMHINEELSYLTTDYKNNAFVTELNNLGTPLINYCNNDKIIISEKLCSCGRTSRIISEVKGRANDYVVCPDGSRKSPFIFSYIVRESMNGKYPNSIKQFRAKQYKNDFIMEIVPGLNYNKDIEQIIKRRMISEIGNGINIDIRIVQKINREKSGKLRYFVRNS